MENYLVYALGFFAQILFGLRLIIQWIYSERAGRVVSPALFWQTSLVASTLFLLYGLLRLDAVIILGQLLSYFIYIRNLQLSGSWQKLYSFMRWSFYLLPFIILGILFSAEHITLSSLWERNEFTNIFFILGMVGQLLLNFRFLYQVSVAERVKASVFPLGFWIISLGASALVVIYAIYRKDPVLLTAQGLGSIVYTRNIILYRRAQANSGYHAS